MSYVLLFAPAWRSVRTLMLLMLPLAAGAARAEDPPPEATAPPQTAEEAPQPFSLSQVGIDLSGFLRSDTAFSTSGAEDPFNQRGNIYNGVPVQRVSPLFTDTATRNGVPAHNTINLQQFRAEALGEWHINDNLTATARVRSVFDGGWYDAFDPAAVGSQAVGRLYGKPDYFRYDAQGSSHPNPLEWSGTNYLVYFPALFLDYNSGPFDVRAGMQQIAWGQAIFFRVLDVPDGLDLRRHSALDYASEEFSDKRVPAPAVRVGYQITDDILADGFVQKFQPTVYGNPETQYNIIPDQFTVHDRYSEFNYSNKLSYGMRFKGNFGQFGWQAMAVRRYNPDGVFRWTQSNVNKGLPTTALNGGLNPLGIAVNASNIANNGGSGKALAGTPFEASPGGVYSANEWFHYAGMVRLDGIQGLNAAVNDFSASTRQVFASPVQNYQQAVDELNTFFVASGGDLRGHIERDYFQETVLGGGLSYVTEGEPGSILDQLIINVEGSYTPSRVYTSPTLGKNFLPQNDWVGALVLEKYYRFSDAFPATYFVLQYMHRTRDDLFGRSLRGYGGTDTYSNDTTSAVPGITNANYVVFAFQQPFPQDIYRVGFATLYDPKGSILVQPGLQYKPNGHWSVDGFYTYINDRLGSNPNNTLLGGLGFANEFTIRIGYQF